MKRHPACFFFLIFFAVAIGLALLLRVRWSWPSIAAWLAAANAVAVPIWAFDKHRARRDGWRVPEATLHAIAFVGAVPASWISMKLFRHKTLKKRFKILYAAFLVIQLGAAAWYYKSRA